MADIAIFRINYKSDFILTLNSDAGWMTPFCIKFWTGAPSQAYFVGFDGTTYTHCAPVEGEPTKLRVQFDDHHLPIGDLKFQIAYHFTVADFPTSVEDEVLNQASVIIEVDDAPAQVMLDFNGETAAEIEFSLPAYANEEQRIANEAQRIANEQQRIANEEARIQAEETRQYNEQQRIQHEEDRVSEFARLKSESEAATTAANAAATLANEKAQLAADKAALAQAAATLANEKAQLAADKAALAQTAATLANDKAALAQQKAEYAQTQGDYAKEQGDYAKEQGDYAKEQGDTALADHQRAETDHGIAVDDHTQAGNDHTRAESDHGIAVEDHTQAGSDHTRAEYDHTQAGNDHTRAESDHATASADHTQADQDHTRAESDHTRAESDHAAVELYVDSLGVFDLSKHNAAGGVLATYADLDAALAALNALDSQYKYGGMSFKFVCSSDNKYVQYRYMGTEITGSPNPFLNTANWQGVDDEPTAGSDNMVKSGGVELKLPQILTAITDTIANNGVTKIGDVYYNASTKKLRKCIVYNTTPSDSIYVDVAPIDNRIYICKGISYHFETINNNKVLVRDSESSRFAYNETENKIIELYLEGIDASKTYIFSVFNKSNSKDQGVIVDTSTNQIVALLDDTEFSKGIVQITENNESGIHGYIIKDIVTSVNTPIILNTSIISNIDNSPSIKEKLLRDGLVGGSTVVYKATNDSKGNYLNGSAIGHGELKELFLQPSSITNEQLASINKIRLINKLANSLFGIKLYHNSTEVCRIAVILNSTSDYKNTGVFICANGAFAYDFSSIEEGAYIEYSCQLDTNVFKIDSCPNIQKEVLLLNGEVFNRLEVEENRGYFINKTSGKTQTTGSYCYTSPIYVLAGQTVIVTCGATNKIAIISETDKDGSYFQTLVEGIDASVRNYIFTATHNMYISISYNYSLLNAVSLIAKGIVDIIPDLTWDEPYLVSASGEISYSRSTFGITGVVEVFEGDELLIEATGSNNTSIISKCRGNGYGIWNMTGGDNFLTPLVVATDNQLHTYKYLADEHCFVRICAYISDSTYPVLHIKRSIQNDCIVVKEIEYNAAKYGEQKHLYVDKYQFVPNTAKRKYNGILTYSADDKNGSGDSNSSNYIANAVAYPNGEIIACRNGGAVVKILNDGTEVPIQYNGADMVITNASDWRGVFVNQNNDVFISPHSSMGKGDNGEISVGDRGLYRIPYGSTTATKVLALYNSVTGVSITVWAKNTPYAVDDVVFYISKLYKCTSAHTSGTDFDSSKFELMPLFATNTAYQVGDIIRQHDNNFVCINAHTSGSGWNSSEQDNWVDALSCMNNQDTIWSMCEDDKGNVYAGVYAHTTRRNPVIYKSADGVNWRYMFNFANNIGFEIPTSWTTLTKGPRHIHGITFNEYDNCLYCALGETNTVFKSSDYGIHWENMECGCYEGKPTSVIGVPDGIILGSDGQWGCALTKILTDGKTAKIVGRIWASFIFYIRRSDLTGWIYAFSRVDNVIQNKGNEQPCPPVEAMTNPAVLEEWKSSVSGATLDAWQQHHDFCKKYYPEDAIIPHHAAIMVSKDNGDSWEILRYEDIGTNGSSGFFTVGYFRDGECLCGLISDEGRESGNVYVQPVVISEGKKKRTSDGKYDLSGEIFIKLNESNIVNT